MKKIIILFIFIFSLFSCRNNFEDKSITHIPMKPIPEELPIPPNPDFMEVTKYITYSEEDKEAGYMYFVIRLMGHSPNGAFMNEAQSNVFGDIPEQRPRAIQWQFAEGSDPSNYFTVKGETLEGYSESTGFSDSSGENLNMPFYIGNEKFKVSLSGKPEFSFVNFVIIDHTVLLFDAYTCFIRLNNSNPLTIALPLDSFNPKIHSTTARVTVYFEPDKNSTNSYYSVIFDGFEPLNNN